MSVSFATKNWTTRCYDGTVFLLIKTDGSTIRRGDGSVTTKKCGVYKITCAGNGKSYYGSSTHIKKRLETHRGLLHGNKHPNRQLQAAFNHHGPATFAFEVVLYCSEEHVLFYEQRMIDAYWDNGLMCFNVARCAEAPARGLRMSDAAKKKMSEAAKGKPKTEETKQKMSEAQKIRNQCPELKAALAARSRGNTYSLGRKHTAETKAKMAASQVGNTKSLGVIHSLESRQKMSEAMKGNINSLGTTRSEESKARTAASIKLWWANRKKEA